MINTQKTARPWLWLATLTGTIVLTGLAAVANRAWNVHCAVSRIEAVGGKVAFASIQKWRPDWNWVRGWGDVCVIDLSRTSLTDEQLEQLLPEFEQLGVISQLDLGGARIHDESLPHLRGFPNLICLSLNDTSITDEGIPAFGPTTDLLELDLSGTQVSDNGLKRIVERHTGLVELHLDRTAVTDTGIRHLSSLPRLKYLSTSNTDVSESLLESLTTGRGKIDFTND